MARLPARRLPASESRKLRLRNSQWVGREPDGLNEVLPAIPAYALASTAYKFTSANVLEIVDQKGVKLPTGASALPAVTDDWFQPFFVSVDEMFAASGSTAVLAAKGQGQAQSGNSQTGINIRGGPTDVGGVPSYSIGLFAGNATQKQFFADHVRSPAIEPGAAHLVIVGQKGDRPWYALVRVEHDGRVDTAIIDVQVGASNSGASSWKYPGTDGTTPAWSAGTYPFLSGFGCNVDVADGGNRRGAAGRVSNYANIWGSFPFVNGAPDPAVLIAIANGTLDAKGMADLVGGTLRYANEFRGPGDLGADPRGVITTAATEVGVNTAVSPIAGAPLRQPPELRLDTYGDRFVFPMKGLAKQGNVPFRGSFTGTAIASSFEARLVRVDTSAPLTGWTQLVATIDPVAKRFSAVMPDIAAGVAFRREIRWRNRTAISVRDGDRQAVGLVLFDVGQSQLAYQGYALNDDTTAGGGGGGSNVAPAQTENVFLSVLKQPFPINAQSLGGGKNGSVALFQPYKAGQHGDGNTYTFETVKRMLGVPVMIVDLAIPGNHPNRLVYDRKTFSYTSTFTPDGTTKAFTFTPACAALVGDGTSIAPGVVPGSLSLQVGSVTVTDDGNGNLTGTGVTAGTINYTTGVFTSLTFATAPASGVVPTGTFKLFCQAPENAQTPQAGGWSAWGDDTLPLDTTNRTGRTVRHLTRMRGVAPSMYRVAWYTAFDSDAGYTNYAAIMDRVKARYDAAYPAGADALWGFAMPTRVTDASKSNDETERKVFGTIQRTYAAGKAYGRLIGEYPDMELAGNGGPHQSGSIGSKVFGERMGVGISAAFTTGLSVEGPVLASAKFTDANRNAIKLTFTLPAGTALTTADGSTTGIAGIRVASAGSNTYTSLGFMAAITGANEVTVTKDSGAWAAGLKVGVQNGAPIYTGTANLTADNATLLKLLSDNDNTFAGQTKYPISGRRGNPTRLADGVVVTDAA